MAAGVAEAGELVGLSQLVWLWLSVLRALILVNCWTPGAVGGAENKKRRIKKIKKRRIKKVKIKKMRIKIKTQSFTIFTTDSDTWSFFTEAEMGPDFCRI